LLLLWLFLVIFNIFIEKNDYIAQKELTERMDRLDAEKKEYIAQQKQSCLEIYQAESKKWSNVRDWRYVESRDACQIVYKDSEPKTKAQCEKNYSTEGLSGQLFIDVITEKLMCLDGNFAKEF